MEATLTSSPVLSSYNHRFHVVMAAIFVLVAFGGFVPSYWLKLAQGSIHVPPIVHVHGFLLFTWTLFYLFQTALVATRRTAAHRTWGLAGISLFTLLVCSIVVTRITMLNAEDAHGFGEAGKRFSAVVFVALPLMIGLFATAIANIRRPEVHKRLMFVLMATMMTPAIARVFIAVLAPPVAAGAPPPPFVAVPPGLVATLFILVAVIYDWRTVGKPHKAYIYGGLLSLVEVFLVVPISGTRAWLQVATFMEHLAG